LFLTLFKSNFFAFYVNPGTPTVPQHPQLRLLSSIALPYVKSVVATDVSNAVIAFSFMVGRSSNDALESVLYETLPETGVVSANSLVFARQIRPRLPSSKPSAVVTGVQDAFVLKSNSSSLDLYGYGFSPSTTLYCLPSVSGASIGVLCSLIQSSSASYGLNFVSPQQLSLLGERWIANKTASINVSMPSSMQSNAPLSLITSVKSTVFQFFLSSGPSAGGFAVTVTGLGFSSLSSPECSFGNGNSEFVLQLTETELVCPIRPGMFSAGARVQNLVVTGMQSAGPFTVVSGLHNELNGVSAFGLSSTASLQFLASASSAINALIISQSKSVMSCSFLSSDFFALNPTSSSSLRIVSQGFNFNVQSGLDLELHSQLVSISPSLPTFALGSETLVFTGSGIGFSKYEVLLIQDPLSFESVYMFCTVVSGQLQCSNLCFSMPIISTPHPDGLILWNTISTSYVNMAIVSI